MGEARNIRFRSVSPHATPPPSKTAQTRVSLRSPIFNPYDRFTQPEFDTWIGDITSALKRALNHEAEPEVDSPSRPRGSWQTVRSEGADRFSAEAWAQSPASSEARDEESTLEDSFARIASRRAKGKARDPREGPGLGLKGQPIELLSDSEEEVVDSLEVDAALSEDSDDSAREGSSDGTDHGDAEYDELDEDGMANLDQPGTSTQHVVPFLQSENFGRGQDVAVHAGAVARLAGDEDLPLPRSTGAFSEDGDDGNERFAVLGDEVGADDGFPTPTQNAIIFDAELTDPWDGPRTYAEDYYAGGDRFAPGLTPNHLTPLSRSPVPTLVPTLPILSNMDSEKSNLPPSPDVLSSLSSLKRQDTANGDGTDVLLRYGTAVTTFVNDEEDIDEPSAGVYYDNVGVVDATTHACRNTETKADGDTEVMKTILISKEVFTSCPTRPNPGTKNGDPDQEPEIIWVPTSDDEHTDADSEEDEGKFLGAVPLGTSDLDVRDDWRVAGRPENINDMPEEDELQEVASVQTADDVTKTAALTLSQFSESGNPDILHVPLVDPQAPILAPTFQFPDADSFGDLPLSSPPSETPSPAPGRPTGAFELQQHSIERLFADLEREASEKRSLGSESPGPIDKQPEADMADGWASRQLENILSGEIAVPDNVADVSSSASTERGGSPEAALSTRYPEYIVEEVKFGKQALPDDDLRDPLSIPPPDSVVEMIRRYEVEEPRSDGRLTEEPEITIESPGKDGTTVPPPTISSIEGIAAPIISEQNVALPPTEEQSTPFAAPSGDTLQGDIFSAVRTIPAPIVADPSVPDPVLRDSPPPTSATTDIPHASGPSLIPPAVLRVHDLDLPQSSRTSGLFTPAQRSEDGTPVLLEDEVAEALTASHGGAGKGLATPSVHLHLQAEDDPSPIDRSDPEDRGATSADDLIEPSQLLSDSEHHLGSDSVEIDTQKSGANGFEHTDEISQPPSREFPRPAVQLTNEDCLPSNDISSGTPQRPGVLESQSSGDGLVGTSSIVEGDDDADGEADPDYSLDDGVKNIHEDVTRQSVEEGEVIPSKTGKDTLAVSETLPMSASTEEQESEAVGETAPAPNANTSSTLQDTPLAEGGDARGSGNLTTSGPSEVKARNGKEGLKRKRRDPIPGPARITRSKSGVGATRGEKEDLSLRRASSQPEKAQSERVDANADGDSVDDGASENASVSSGASAVHRLLHASRAGSVVSSASGDAFWTSPLTPIHSRVIPLVHSHGLHHHGLPVPPRHASPTPSTGTPKGTRSERAKGKSPTPSEPSSPSLRRAPSTNSPVTRSNCRFHKISLPRGEDRTRAYFVVPGCALGDGGLMDSEDIRDEGLSTREDHKRMLPNVEVLELNPYLVGVLRQLVGVDLLREQQEIFYLPSEEEKPRKRRQMSALESLRQFQRQSISSGGPLAREHSPRPSEISFGRGSSRSASGSVASGSVRGDSVLPSEGEESALSDPDNDNPPDSAPPPVKRHKPFVVEMSPRENTSAAGELGSSAVPEHSASAGNESAISSSKALATRRSKRKAIKYDAAAYKPSEDEVKGDEEVEETERRRSSTRKAIKRSRTLEESSANAPRSKKTRLGRAISVAGAGATDS